MPVAPIVTIDVAPDTAAYLTTAAVRGCEAALGEGGCVGAEVTSPGTPWRAQVDEHLGADTPAVTIQLSAGGSSIVYQTRVLEFSEADAERQRWASVGVVIAAMVADQRAENPSATEGATPGPDDTPTPGPPLQPAPSQPGFDADTPAPIPQDRDAPTRFDLGALAGTGTTRSLSYGGMLRFSVGLREAPLFVLASGTFAYASGDFDSTLTSGGAGFGVRLGTWDQPLALELRAEAVLQYVSVRATRNRTENSDYRWRGGGRLGADGVWAMTRNWHLVAGVEASLLRPEVVVEVVSNDQTGSIPAVGWASTVSLRFSD